MTDILPGLPGGWPINEVITPQQAFEDYVGAIRRADIHSFARWQQAVKYGLLP